MAAAICMEAFDAIMLMMKPVNCSLDRKGSLIIALIVIHFFSNNFALKRNGKISPVLGHLISTFHKKVVFFFGRKKNFAHVNKGYCLLISVDNLHG